MAKENTEEKHSVHSLNPEKSRNPLLRIIICVAILGLTLFYLLPTGTIIGHKQKNAASAFILNIFQSKTKENEVAMKDKCNRKEAYSGQKK